MTNVCENCGHEVSPESPDCPFCGQPRSDAYPGTSRARLVHFRLSAPGAAAGGHASRLATDVHLPAQLEVHNGTVAPGTEGEMPQRAPDQVIRLEGQQITIGRAPSCDVTFADDPLVSRHHALLKYEDGVYGVVDLGSSNGTFVNGRALTGSAALAHNDVVVIGGNALQFVQLPPEVVTGPLEAVAPDPQDTREVLAGLSTSSLEFVPSASAAGSIPLAAISVPGSVPLSAASAGEALTSGGSVAASGNLSSISWQPIAPPSTPLAPEKDTRLVEGDGLPGDASGRQVTVRAFEHLQQQWRGLSDEVFQRASEDARQLARQRAALIAVSDMLTAILHQVEDRLTTLEPIEVGSLVDIVEQTAANPRHVDYVLALATHAGDLAKVLRVWQEVLAPTGVSAVLRTLQQQIESAARDQA